VEEQSPSLGFPVCITRTVWPVTTTELRTRHLECTSQPTSLRHLAREMVKIKSAVEEVANPLSRMGAVA
jgi:hypothetical protein